MHCKLMKYALRNTRLYTKNGRICSEICSKKKQFQKMINFTIIFDVIQCTNTCSANRFSHDKLGSRPQPTHPLKYNKWDFSYSRYLTATDVISTPITQKSNTIS